MKTKPSYEKVNPDFGNSILVKQHSGSYPFKKASWHYHPEIELVYVNKGCGTTHIGNHISYFNNSQLILIGSNLPHNGFTDRLTVSGSETLIQFKEEVLGNAFLNIPEMQKINSLFERSKKGLVYGKETKAVIGIKIQNLSKTNGLERIISLLEILNELSKSEDYTILNADGFAFETKSNDSNKIDVIYKYVNQNFQNVINLETISDKVNMTIPAFCRYFKKTTGKTFTNFVNEFRIVYATKLLSESQMNITETCYECGFNNYSHFNKVFKDVTGKSASKYRNELKLIIK